jgi:hypothetical protein
MSARSSRQRKNDTQAHTRARPSACSTQCLLKQWHAWPCPSRVHWARGTHLPQVHVDLRRAAARHGPVEGVVREQRRSPHGRKRVQPCGCHTQQWAQHPRVCAADDTPTPTHTHSVTCTHATRAHAPAAQKNPTLLGRHDMTHVWAVMPPASRKRTRLLVRVYCRRIYACLARLFPSPMVVPKRSDRMCTLFCTSLKRRRIILYYFTE